MAFETRSQNSSISQINVVPLVDVMLVLLVIFMVTAPILQQGVSVELPQAKAGALSGGEEQLVVSIDKKGTVYLNDNAITVQELGPKLEAGGRVKPDQQGFLRAEPRVPVGGRVGGLAPD